MFMDSKDWAGNFYGTNTAKVFLDFEHLEQNKVNGILRFNDDVSGLIVYKLSGETDGTSVKIIGIPDLDSDGGKEEEVRLNGTLNSEGKLVGKWDSSIGKGGTFILFPHGDLQKHQLSPPKQLYVNSKNLKPIKLSRKGLKDLIGVIGEGMLPSEVIVTVKEGANETSFLASNLSTKNFDERTEPYLKLSVQDPIDTGQLRSVVLELLKTGENFLRVQSTDKNWSAGRTELISSELAKYERSFLSFFKKSSGYIQLLLLIALLVILPEFSDWKKRMIVTIGCFALMISLGQLYKRKIPNFEGQFSSGKESIFKYAWSYIWPVLSQIFAGLLLLALVKYIGWE